MIPIITRRIAGITLTANFGNEPARQVHIDSAAPMLMSIDEAHTLHSHLTDFLASVREANGGRRDVPTEPESVKSDLHPTFPPTMPDRRNPSFVPDGGFAEPDPSMPQ